MVVDPDLPQVEEYRLDLDVDFAAQRWSGVVEFDVEPAPSLLPLDSEELDIRGATVDGRPAAHRLDAGENRLEIRLPSAGPRARIRIEFAGRVDPKNMTGLYRSRLGDGYALVTQCEAIGARRVFPCLDRPDRKARFRLTVRTEAEQEVISNTAPEHVERDGGLRVWRFPPTPMMATYLFFLGIGRFARIEDRSGRVGIGVWTAPGRERSGAFALGTSRRVLEAFERYFGLPYPLPKLDLIGVPEHPFGAMENWGAISFREMRLLVDERTNTFGRRFTYETIAHELAHQWFGNLVTMRWWTDVWLNESFATFMEVKVIGQLSPKVRPIQEFFYYWGGRALRTDSLACTKPVRVPVERPEEIHQVFDPAISYGKGASVLRMIEGYLGDEAFRAGVTDYLRRFQWKNASTDDLWEALGRASHQPIPEILGPWIETPGLPVVQARCVPGGLELTQRTFRQDGAHLPGSWRIPMVIDRGGRIERFRLDSERAVIPDAADRPIHLNSGALGFYRTLYEPALYDRLLGTFAQRSMEDRWIVLEDLASFVLSGDVPFETFARFARDQAGAPEYPVVTSIAGSLRQLAEFAPQATPVVDLARSVLADQFDRMGPRARPGEPDGTGIAREAVALSRAALDAGFARDLSELFPEWERLDPDLRAAVALGRIRTEGAVAHREVLHRLRQRPPEGETSGLENALSWSPDPALVEATLDLGLAAELNRGHFWTVIIEAARNPAGRDPTWRWMQRHVAELNGFFHGTDFLPQLLYPVVPLLGLGRSDEVRAFFAPQPFPEATRGVDSGLEMLTIAERFARRVGPIAR